MSELLNDGTALLPALAVLGRCNNIANNGEGDFGELVSDNPIGGVHHPDKIAEFLIEHVNTFTFDAPQASKLVASPTDDGYLASTAITVNGNVMDTYVLIFDLQFKFRGMVHAHAWAETYINANANESGA